MFKLGSYTATGVKIAVTATVIGSLCLSPLAFAHDHEEGKDKLAASAAKEVTGEVVDMMCYVDHNAMGDKHSPALRSA